MAEPGRRGELPLSKVEAALEKEGDLPEKERIPEGDDLKISSLPGRLLEMSCVGSSGVMNCGLARIIRTGLLRLAHSCNSFSSRTMGRGP